MADKDIKGILKKDGEPKRDVGPVTVAAPIEDPNKQRSSRVLTREDTKHHVLEGVEWPEGEDAPKAVLSVPKPRNSIQKKKPASSDELNKPAVAAAAPAAPADPPKKEGGCVLV